MQNHLDGRHANNQQLDLTYMWLNTKCPRFRSIHPQIHCYITVASRLSRLQGWVKSVFNPCQFYLRIFAHGCEAAADVRYSFKVYALPADIHEERDILHTKSSHDSGGEYQSNIAIHGTLRRKPSALKYPPTKQDACLYWETSCLSTHTNGQA